MGKRKPTPAPRPDLREVLEDALTFGVPVISEDGGAPPAVEVTPTGAPAVSRRIDAAFRSYLGKRAAAIRPETLPDLLSRAFTETEVRGHYEYSSRRKPLLGGGRAAGPSVAPELTGAAAVLYSYATSAISQCKEKLSSFEPLYVLEIEKELQDTIRDVANADLDELLGAFETEDIVVERVELAFAKLGIVDATARAETVKGNLGEVRERFGLRRTNIRTVRDERIVTEFGLMIDLLVGLRRTWNDNKDFFTTDEPSAALSRKIWLLERWQGIALERIETIGTVLEQSGLDPASIELELSYMDPADAKKKRTTEMFFSDLLSWTSDALQQGLGMPAESDELSGDEAVSFLSTIREVAALVTAAGTAKARIGGVGVPEKYRWYRIKVALADLASALQVISGQVADIAKSTVTVNSARVQKPGYPAGTTHIPVGITISGSHLPSRPSVALELNRPGRAPADRFEVVVLQSDAAQISGFALVEDPDNVSEARVIVTDGRGASQEVVVNW